jgi:hypothetical protein
MKKELLILFVLLLIPITLAANVEIILDVSGSMNDKVGDQTKLEAAKQTISEFVASLPADTNVALRVFGADVAECSSGLKLPFQAANSIPLENAFSSLQANGKTPLASSISDGVVDFGGKDKEKNYLILVSDGAETCKGDPCSVMQNKRNDFLTVHTIGFSITEQGKDQLKCVASAGGGKYFDSTSQGQLKQAFDEIRDQVLGIAAGDSFDTAPLITPGQYGYEFAEETKGDYYYKIKVKDSERLALHYYAEGKNPEINIKIYDSTRKEIKKGQFEGSDFASGKFYYDPGETIIAEETYFIRLFEQDFYYRSGVDKFTLKVGLEDLSDANSGEDAGKDFDEALLISPGVYNNNLQDNDYIDIFKIPVKGAEQIAVKLTPGGEYIFSLNIFNENRETIKRQSAKNAGAIVRLLQNITDDEFIYIKTSIDEQKIFKYKSDYTLEVTLESPDDPCDFIQCKSYQSCKEGQCVDRAATEDGSKGSLIESGSLGEGSSNTLLYVIIGVGAIIFLAIIGLIIAVLKKKS